MRKDLSAVHAALDEFAEAGAVGRFFANRLPNGEWFTWVEQVIKLREMKPSTAAAIRMIVLELGTTKLEMICEHGEADRVNVSRGI